jgi:hypothetical protein
MKTQILFAVSVAAALSSCATNYSYEPIVPNAPNLEMTQARCQMMASSADQGVIAFGSTSYVAGAQLGNAIGNAVREDQFVHQCMTINGWRRVAGPQKPVHQTQPTYSALGKPYKGQGAFPPPPSALAPCPTNFPKPISQMTQLEKARYGVNKPGCPAR